MNQISVVYKNKPLMPCSKRRAHAMVKCGKAKWDHDKILGKYIILLQEPSDYVINTLALGIDTGTMFSGFSVVGNKTSVNVEMKREYCVCNNIALLEIDYMQYSKIDKILQNALQLYCD